MRAHDGACGHELACAYARVFIFVCAHLRVSVGVCVHLSLPGGVCQCLRVCMHAKMRACECGYSLCVYMCA